MIEFFLSILVGTALFSVFPRIMGCFSVLFFAFIFVMGMVFPLWGLIGMMNHFENMSSIFAFCFVALVPVGLFVGVKMVS